MRKRGSSGNSSVNFMFITILILLLVVSIYSFFGKKIMLSPNEVFVSNCSVLDGAYTTYYLTENVTSSIHTCMNINANNIILDCQGNTITVNTDRCAVDSFAGSTEIRNCIFRIHGAVGGAGICLDSSNNSIIHDNTFYSDSEITGKHRGIDMSNSFSGRITDNKFTHLGRGVISDISANNFFVVNNVFEDIGFGSPIVPGMNENIETPSPASSAVGEDNLPWGVLTSFLIGAVILMIIVLIVVEVRMKKSNSNVNTSPKSMDRDEIITKDINFLLNEGDKLVKRGRIEDARDRYKKIQSIYNKLERKDTRLRVRILQFYRELV